jgi:hypothetical protein
MDETYENSEKFIPVITLDFGSWFSFGVFCLILPISLYLMHKAILATKEYDLFPVNKEDKLAKKILNILLNTFIVVILSGVWSGSTFGIIEVLFTFKNLATASLYMTPLFILVWLKSYSMKKQIRENDSK